MVDSVACDIQYYPDFLKFPKYHILYFVIKASDVSGTGKVIIDSKALVDKLGRTRPTIKKWVLDCWANGYFRYCEWIGQSKILIYYTNFKNLTSSLGIADVSESLILPIEDFRGSLNLTLQLKRCSRCGELKPLKDFPKNNTVKDGYNSCCKACIKLSNDANKDAKATYREENRNRIYSQNKVYRELNKDVINQKAKEYRENNGSYYAEYSREYSKINSDKVKARTAKRRALKKSVSTTDPWELAQITVFYRDCPDGHHVDHILPLALGGHHELSNLQHLETWMNRNKSDKHPDNWDDPRPISCRA